MSDDTGMTPLSDAYNLLWLDIESTGLLPGHHEVVEIGAFVTNAKGEPLLFDLSQLSFEVRIKPRYSERDQDLKAQAIHGLFYDQGDDGVDAKVEFKKWIRWACERFDTKPFLIAGWNVHWDARMLKHDFLEWCGIDTKWLFDLSPICHALWMSKLRLDDVIEALGIKPEGRHRALGDARVEAEVWRKIADHLPVFSVR